MSSSSSQYMSQFIDGHRWFTGTIASIQRPVYCSKNFTMSANGDFDSETVYGKPVQVISIDENENTFSLNEENLNLVLSRIPAKMKLSVVSVVGAFRTGKSFLLDFFLKIFTLSTKQNGRGSMEQPFYIENKVRR